MRYLHALKSPVESPRILFIQEKKKKRKREYNLSEIRSVNSMKKMHDMKIWKRGEGEKPVRIYDEEESKTRTKAIWKPEDITFCSEAVKEVRFSVHQLPN